MRIGRKGRVSGIHRKTTFLCGFCGKEFKNWAYRKFCSRTCYWNFMKGKPINIEITEEERQRRRDRMVGENNPMWCGGDSDRDRRNAKYKKWRIDVFERDNFTCCDCGYVNGKGKKRRGLNAHHIVAWIESIELRYALENGITLCVPCHIKRHSKH